MTRWIWWLLCPVRMRCEDESVAVDAPLTAWGERMTVATYHARERFQVHEARHEADTWSRVERHAVE